MTAVDVDALDAARTAATPGPWIVWHAPDVITVAAGHTMVGSVPSNPTSWIGAGHTVADAALIVAAVNALPELLAEVRRGRALRERLEGLAWALENEATDAFASWDTLAAREDAVDRLRAALAAVDGGEQP